MHAVAVEALGPYLACFDGVKANQISDDTDVRQTKRYWAGLWSMSLRMKKPVSRCDRAEGVVDGEKIT